MDHGDVLLTLAEVSVTFAGFSGVVAFFGRRDPDSWSFADRIRFFLLVGYSLSVLFLCIFPFGLLAIHLSQESVWRILSALLASIVVASFILALRQLRAASPSERAELTPIFMGLGIAVVVLIVLLSIYNVVLVGEFGLFLVALILLLGLTGFLFARMLVAGFGGDRAA